MNRNIHNIDTSYKEDLDLSTYKIKDGDKLTLVVSGGKIKDTMQAIDLLELQHQNAIDFILVSRIKPLNLSLIVDSLIKTNKLLVIEDHGILGSIYQQILSLIHLEKALKHDCLNLKNEVMSGYGSYEELSSKYNLSKEKIYMKLLDMLNQ